MATSNFQQWNNAAINQETDSEYTADANRTGGWGTDAIVPSPTLNKVFYQSSTFITAFGVMMAAKGYSTSDADVSVLAAVLANLLTEADVLPSIVTVAYSPTPSFNAAIANGFQMTLSGNVSSSTISGVSPGQLVAFYFAQDSVGGRTVSWPSSMVGTLQPDPTANAVSLMLFRADLSSILRAASPMISNNGVFFNAVTVGSLALAAGANAGAILMGNGTTFVARSLTMNSSTGHTVGTIYQNTSAGPMMVVASGFLTGSYGQGFNYTASVGPTSGGLSYANNGGVHNDQGEASVTFIVPHGYYYQVVIDNSRVSNGQIPTQSAWIEYTYV